MQNVTSTESNCGAGPRLARRARISASGTDLVRTWVLDDDRGLPLGIEPATPGVDLAPWIRFNRHFIEEKLLRHGAILFRNFRLAGQQDFERVVESFGFQTMHYMEGATPRTELSNRVYTSTEFPADQAIALHNELSYVVTWPMRICFFCVQPAASGGETPIADVRRVLRRIPPHIARQFEDRQWMLVRNFGEGLSLPWQKTFRVATHTEVEDYCRLNRIDWEWRDGGRLRTTQVRPAIAAHPKTGEPVWFNHAAFWHASSLAPSVLEVFLADFGEDGLPYNTYFGDGSRIDTGIAGALREAYDAETVAFPWRKGDLLLLDNMLAAHGRRPFTGDRRVIVSMGDAFTRTDLNSEF